MFQILARDQHLVDRPVIIEFDKISLTNKESEEIKLPYQTIKLNDKRLIEQSSDGK